jgi:hypothetical protein
VGTDVLLPIYVSMDAGEKVFSLRRGMWRYLHIVCFVPYGICTICNCTGIVDFRNRYLCGMYKGGYRRPYTVHVVYGSASGECSAIGLVGANV